MLVRVEEAVSAQVSPERVRNNALHDQESYGALPNRAVVLVTITPLENRGYDGMFEPPWQRRTFEALFKDKGQGQGEAIGKLTEKQRRDSVRGATEFWLNRSEFVVDHLHVEISCLCVLPTGSFDLKVTKYFTTFLITL